jgi:hypothetical protein
MKKNILLVQSLVLLSAVATLPLLGGKTKNRNQKPQYAQKNQQKQKSQQPKQFTFTQTQQPITEEKNQQQIETPTNHFQSEEQQLNNYFEIVKNPLYNPEAHKQCTSTQTEQPVIAEKAPVVAVSHQQLMNELTASTIFQSKRMQHASPSANEYHPIETETVDFNMSQFFDEPGVDLGEPYITQEITPENLLKSETEIINISLPECMQNNNNNNNLEATSINPELLQSVMLPTEDKGLTWLEKIAYYTSTKHQVVQSIIKQLENRTFDASNRTAIDIFTEAVTTATNNSDVQSLATIADLCSKNYPQTIRLFDDVVAQQASGFLTTHYMTELTRANATMQGKRQEHIKEWTVETAACVKAMSDLITNYNQKVKNIADNYHNSIEQEEARIKTLRTQVSTFSLLNKQTRENSATVLTSNKLDRPTNKFAKTMMESESRLNYLAKVAQDMPQILTFEVKTKCLAALDEKK